MRKSFFIATALVAQCWSSAANAEAGDILVKARATYHQRSDGFAVVLTNSADTIDANVQDTVGGEVSATSFLTDHIAIETSLGAATYNLEDVQGDNVVSAGLLLATMNLQYHLAPTGSLVRPYVGVGLTYMNFYGEDIGEVVINDMIDPADIYTTGIKGGISPTVQVGADVALTNQFYVNIDLKYASRRTEFYLQSDNRQTVARRMDTLMLAGGVGFRF